MVKAQEIKEKSYVSNLLLGVTNDCNMRCRYCFTTPNKRQMSLDTAKSAIEWGLSRRIRGEEFTVIFFGGEPMLRFDDLIVPIVDWIENKNQDIKLSITTNGTLLTPKRLEWMYAHNLPLLLSIDGGPETQNYNRILLNGGDSFKPLEEVIPYILHFFPGTVFRSTVYPDTVHLLYENYLWAEAFGFHRWFGGVDESAEWSDEKVLVYGEQLQKIFWHIYNRIESGREATITTEFFETIKRLFNISIHNQCPYLRCGLGTVTASVGPDGEIYGCQEHLTYGMDSPFYLGNIFKDGIEDNRIEKLVNDYLSSSCPADECPSHTLYSKFNYDDKDCISQYQKNMEKNIIFEIMKYDAKNGSGKFKKFLIEQLGGE